MGFTVAHRGGTKDTAYAQYVRLLSRLLLKRGINLDRVPRVPEDGTDSRWLFVWDSEEEAEQFRKQLRRETRDPDWLVRKVESPPSLGPLQPIEVQAGRRRDGWVFTLSPLAQKAIQQRFPGSCENDTVSIGNDNPSAASLTKDAFCRLTRQVLPILTGLEPEDLSTFGSYRVVDPVSGRVLIAPTPFLHHEEAPGSADGASFHFTPALP